MTAGLIDIRAGQPDDAEALAIAHEEAWKLAYSGIIPFPHLDRMIARRGPNWWRFALANGAGLMVIEFDGTLAGYSSFGPVRRKWGGYRGEIFELYLKPEYQGIGLGRRLFLATRTELAVRRLDGVLVWALCENQSACGFYGGIGGREIARASESFGGRQLDKIAFGWPAKH